MVLNMFSPCSHHGSHHGSHHVEQCCNAGRPMGAAPHGGHCRRAHAPTPCPQTHAPTPCPQAHAPTHHLCGANALAPPPPHALSTDAPLHTLFTNANSSSELPSSADDNWAPSSRKYSPCSATSAVICIWYL
eukprot:65229-Chlamydomonas_euryale.AAC.4